MKTELDIFRLDADKYKLWYFNSEFDEENEGFSFALPDFSRKMVCEYSAARQNDNERLIKEFHRDITYFINVSLTEEEYRLAEIYAALSSISVEKYIKSLGLGKIPFPEPKNAQFN